ncbi:MAG: lysophospholipase [Ruminococcus sp.]|jgi:dienelactone hydrolase|nr:lysophospholipase [Ruminococcus sp.]
MKKFRKIKIISIILIIILLIYIIGGFVITNITLKQSFARVDNYNEYYQFTTIHYSDYEDVLPRTPISFMSGKNKLQGYIFGENNSKGLVVVVHGFGGGWEDYSPDVKFFVDNGYLVLAYSGTGVFESEGKSRVNFSQSSVDLRNCLEYINNDSSLNSLPLTLFGHSQGGFAVCDVLNYDEAKNVDFVVSVSGVAKASGIVDAAAEEMMGNSYALLKPFLVLSDREDFSGKTDSITGINNSDAKILLFQGTDDTVVPADKYAITHFKDEITNPNCKIAMKSDEWNSEHMNILESKNAYYYNKDFEDGYKEYLKNEGKERSSNIALEYYRENGYDKFKGHEIDEMLFEQIVEFIQA